MGDDSQNLYASWKNGSGFYFSAMSTVRDLKESVYGSADKVPKAVRAGCRGRMMEDSDNLALAVRTFCRRDPKIVLWEEETAKLETAKSRARTAEPGVASCSGDAAAQPSLS